MAERILIIDDEVDLAKTLAYNLERQGYAAAVAHTANAGLGCADAQPPPDLILLDLMLPDLPGTEVCRQLRANPKTRGIPIVMLTAKSDEIDRVVGFEVGADDYVVKPFSVRELLLRVRAILRRASGPQESAGLQTFGILELDPESHRVKVEGKDVLLTALEFRLLETFLSRRGRVQTRETLLDDVWGIRADVTTRTVDTHVKRLRQKIGAAGDYIETLRGVGYRFRPDPNAAPAEAPE